MRGIEASVFSQIATYPDSALHTEEQHCKLPLSYDIHYRRFYELPHPQGRTISVRGHDGENHR